MKNEIETYKKKLKKFRFCGLMIIFFVGIYFLLSIKFASKKYVIVACAIFCITVLIFLIILTLLNGKRNHLVNKYYIKISKEDSHYAAVLLQNIEILRRLDLEYISSKDVESYIYSVELILKSISKRKRIYYKMVEDLENIIKEIQKSTPEEIENNIMSINYLHEVYELSRRNIAEI